MVLLVLLPATCWIQNPAYDVCSIFLTCAVLTIAQVFCLWSFLWVCLRGWQVHSMICSHSSADAFQDCFQHLFLLRNMAYLRFNIDIWDPVFCCING